MMEVDHDLCQTHVEQMQVLPPEYLDLAGTLRPSPESLSARLTSPVVATYIDTHKISFERYYREKLNFPLGKAGCDILACFPFLIGTSLESWGGRVTKMRLSMVTTVRWVH